MDAINLILTALMSGAAVGTQAMATNAVKDAYQGLKSLIQNKSTEKTTTEMVLAKFDENAESWKKPMRDLLIEIKADQDQLILETAQLFLTQLKAQEAQGPKFNVQIQGNVQGIAQGDQSNITMNFNESSKTNVAQPSKPKK